MQYNDKLGFALLGLGLGSVGIQLGTVVGLVLALSTTADPVQRYLFSYYQRLSSAKVPGLLILESFCITG